MPSVHIDITKPTGPWLSAYQEMTFGFDTPLVKPGLGGVTNVGGKARFDINIFGSVSGCKCRYIYVPDGIYQGVHKVTNVTYVTSPMLGGIYFETETDYIGNQTGYFYCMPNITYRIWYGYPTLDQSIDVEVIYRPDQSMHVNLATFLQSTFANKIQPPIPGFDENMYTHFKVEVIGDDDFTQYLSDLGYDINYLTQYDWTDDDNKWYVCNGTLPNNALNVDHTGAGEFLSEQNPILFDNHCAVYSIVAGENNDRIYNVFSCLGTSANQGIGYMEIGTSFIVS